MDNMGRPGKLGKKWERKAEDLFDWFKTQLAEVGIEPIEIFDSWRWPAHVKLMIERMGEGEAREFVSWAAKNWTELRGRERDDRVLKEIPNFHQMIAEWRYAKWYPWFKTGLEVKEVKSEKLEGIKRSTW
jgi:hypothetical protein